MKVKLLEVEAGVIRLATIGRADKQDMPVKKNGWNFNWQELLKTEGASVFKITLDETPEKIEGLVMLSVYFEEMVFMNNLELAPHNIGASKKYEYVAGILIAFGCRYGLENGKGNYQGYLTFESKTELIPLYEKKYGATAAMGQKMFIDPVQGGKLISQYLES
ncbi:MAG: hypothetical protein R3D00_02520 [Bacteroidia bacterium]